MRPLASGGNDRRSGLPAPADGCSALSTAAAGWRLLTLLPLSGCRNRVAVPAAGRSSGVRLRPTPARGRTALVRRRHTAADRRHRSVAASGKGSDLASGAKWC